MHPHEEDRDVLNALNVLGANAGGQAAPAAIQDLIQDALSTADENKLDALNLLATTGRLDAVELAKVVFNCDDDGLHAACATSLAYGDRKKLNTVRLLSNQNQLEWHEDEAERITSLCPSFFIPLVEEIRNPIDPARSGWAEYQTADYPTLQERLDAALKLEPNFLRKLQTLDAIAPALERIRDAQRRIRPNAVSYCTDTRGAALDHGFIRAMQALGFEYSVDGFVMNPGSTPDVPAAIAGFRSVCSIAPVDANDSFCKLAAHWNLVATHVRHEFEPGQSAMEKHDAIMATLRETLDAARRIPAPHLSREAAQRLVALIYKATLLHWNSLGEEEKSQVAEDACQLLQTNRFFLQMALMPFQDTVLERKFLNNPDMEDRARFAALVDRLEAGEGHALPRLKNLVWATLWKETGETACLDKLLKLPDMKVLEYFDLFQHARTPDDRQRIAETVVRRHRELRRHFPTEGIRRGEDMLCLFAIGMMIAYYSIQHRDRRPSGDALSTAAVAFDICSRFLAEPNEHRNEIDSFRPEDIQLLQNLAFLAASTKAELSSAPMLAHLCAGRDPEFVDMVTALARDAREGSRDGLRRAANRTLDRQSPTYAIDEAFARHCLSELLRTETRPAIAAPEHMAGT